MSLWKVCLRQKSPFFVVGLFLSFLFSARAVKRREARRGRVLICPSWLLAPPVPRGQLRGAGRRERALMHKLGGGGGRTDGRRAEVYRGGRDFKDNGWNP